MILVITIVTAIVEVSAGLEYTVPLGYEIQPQSQTHTNTRVITLQGKKVAMARTCHPASGVISPV